MENQSQQIIDYIKQHLSQGFSEGGIRNHLLANGWTQQAVDQAFEQYYRGLSPSPSTPPPQPVAPQFQQPNLSLNKRKRPLLEWVIGAVVVVVLLLLTLFIHFANSPSTVNKLAAPALQSNADNTSRKNDVAMLTSALASYIDSHQGTFPQSTATDATPKTLDICGPNCSSPNKVTVQLGYYANTPSAVSFHSYSSNLEVPDLQTVYIVPNANCKSDNSGIGVSTIGQKYLSIVVLYAIQSETTTKQQCLSPY